MTAAHRSAHTLLPTSSRRSAKHTQVLVKPGRKGPEAREQDVRMPGLKQSGWASMTGRGRGEEQAGLTGRGLPAVRTRGAVSSA